jgi:hypothetical protein
MKPRGIKKKIKNILTIFLKYLKNITVQCTVYTCLLKIIVKTNPMGYVSLQLLKSTNAKHLTAPNKTC